MATKRKQEPRDDDASPYLAWDSSHNVHRGMTPSRDERRINLQWKRHRQRILTRNALSAAIRAARLLPRPEPAPAPVAAPVKKARKPTVKKAAPPEGEGMKLVKKVRAKASKGAA